MRFASEELQQQAFANEELHSRRGILGCCLCLLGVILTVVGLAAPVVSLDPFFESVRSFAVTSGAQGFSVQPTISWLQSASESFAHASFSPSSSLWTTSPTLLSPPPSPAEQSRGPESPQWTMPSPPPPPPIPEWWYSPPPKTSKASVRTYDMYGFEVDQGVDGYWQYWQYADFPLFFICGTLVAICFLPSVCRWFVFSDPVAPVLGGMARSPWASSHGAGGCLGAGHVNSTRPSAFPETAARTPLFGHGVVGDRGGSLGGGSGMFGSIFGQPSSEQFGARAGYGVGSAVDANYFCDPPSRRQRGLFGLLLSWFGSLLSGFAYLFGFTSFAGWALPSEAEVVETYAAAPQLPQWAAAIANMIGEHVIDSLLKQLDASDRKLEQDLQLIGWRLVFEEPQMRFFGGRPTDVQELSIFDATLPQLLSSYPSAVAAWNQRQSLERFLHHPGFDRAATRGYVLSRLREWHQGGIFQRDLAASMHPHGTEVDRRLPSDAHILENIMIRTLQLTFPDFGPCFVSPDARSPPQRQHLGQMPSAWLRQIASQQGRFAKPSPHYEVVTPGKAWKLRPGNVNMLEALALLMHILRTTSRSYSAFPEMLRTALEKNATSNMMY
eukprot:TRINITY_DN21796_c0_g1_i1.p1 TRINITY_DN21796_c0_g1~~TRINITY_DN21796_c0_g1_i1.p1  ORF type:complete len:611 (+),score=74.82 TRINITY_DN21796_c0_g1_i1:166-1998(+)